MQESNDESAYSLEANPPIAPLESKYILSDTETTVGRHPSNDLMLPFESVSRFHARLERRNSDIYVVDLGSSNGTYINDVRVTEGILRQGDQVSFGNVSFAFSLAEPSTEEKTEIRTHGTSSVRFVAASDDMLQSVVQKMAKGDTTAARTLPSDISDVASFDRARKLLKSIYEFHKYLGSKTEEVEIYETTLNLIFEALPCERGVVLVRNDEDSGFHPVQVRVRGREADSGDIAISQTIIDRCLSDRVAILSRDAMADKRFESSESIMLHDIRSAMCAPMVSREEVLAICFVDTSETRRTFGEADLDFFASLMAEVAILIDNARLRSEMMRSEQMAVIGETITGIAHNVKNVLLLSQGGIGMLDACLEKKDYEAVGKTWDLVKVGLERINSMVNDMLDFARHRRGVKRLASVNRIIQETLDFVAKDFAEKHIKLSVSLDPKIPDCLIDDQGFYKAFLNLLVNATEAVEKGTGQISVRTRFDDDGMIRVFVEDNGAGIPPEQMPKIFQPFFTTKGSRGNGLGLPMTRKLLEEMKGKIVCRSKPESGTRFEITIRPHVVDGKDTISDEPDGL